MDRRRELCASRMSRRCEGCGLPVYEEMLEVERPKKGGMFRMKRNFSRLIIVGYGLLDCESGEAQEGKCSRPVVLDRRSVGKRTGIHMLPGTEEVDRVWQLKISGEENDRVSIEELEI